MDVLDPILPALIRGARSLLGWSQKELAEKADVSTQFVSRYELGKTRGRPNNVKSLLAVLAEAGVSFDFDESPILSKLSPQCGTQLRKNIRNKQIENE